MERNDVEKLNNKKSTLSKLGDAVEKLAWHGIEKDENLPEASQEQEAASLEKSEKEMIIPPVASKIGDLPEGTFADTELEEFRKVRTFRGGQGDTSEKSDEKSDKSPKDESAKNTKGDPKTSGEKKDAASKDIKDIETPDAEKILVDMMGGESQKREEAPQSALEESGEFKTYEPAENIEENTTSLSQAELEAKLAEQAGQALQSNEVVPAEKEQEKPEEVGNVEPIKEEAVQSDANENAKSGKEIGFDEYELAIIQLKKLLEHSFDVPEDLSSVRRKILGLGMQFGIELTDSQSKSGDMPYIIEKELERRYEKAMINNLEEGLAKAEAELLRAKNTPYEEDANKKVLFFSERLKNWREKIENNQNADKQIQTPNAEQILVESLDGVKSTREKPQIPEDVNLEKELHNQAQKLVENFDCIRLITTHYKSDFENPDDLSRGIKSLRDELAATYEKGVSDKFFLNAAYAGIGPVLNKLWKINDFAGVEYFKMQLKDKIEKGIFYLENLLEEKQKKELTIDEVIQSAVDEFIKKDLNAPDLEGFLGRLKEVGMEEQRANEIYGIELEKALKEADEGKSQEESAGSETCEVEIEPLEGEILERQKDVSEETEEGGSLKAAKGRFGRIAEFFKGKKEATFEKAEGIFEALNKQGEKISAEIKGKSPWVREKVDGVADWYKKRKLWEKVLFSTGCIAAASASAAIGGAVGTAIATAAFTGTVSQRFLGSIATFVTAEGMLKKAVEKGGRERTSTEAARHTAEAAILALLVGTGEFAKGVKNISDAAGFTDLLADTYKNWFPGTEVDKGGVSGGKSAAEIHKEVEELEKETRAKIAESQEFRKSLESAEHQAAKAHLEELITIKKGEGAWHAVYRQLEERLNSEPEKFGLSAEDLNDTAKIKSVLDKKTMDLLVKYGFIDLENKTEIRILNPGTEVMLMGDESDKIVIPSEEDGFDLDDKSKFYQTELGKVETVGLPGDQIANPADQIANPDQIANLQDQLVGEFKTPKDYIVNDQESIGPAKTLSTEYGDIAAGDTEALSDQIADKTANIEASEQILTDFKLSDNAGKWLENDVKISSKSEWLQNTLRDKNMTVGKALSPDFYSANDNWLESAEKQNFKNSVEKLVRNIPFYERGRFENMQIGEFLEKQIGMPKSGAVSEIADQVAGQGNSAVVQPEIMPEAGPTAGDQTAGDSASVKSAAEIAGELTPRKQEFLDTLIYKTEMTKSLNIEDRITAINVLIKNNTLTAEDFAKYYENKTGKFVSNESISALKENFRLLNEGNTQQREMAKRGLESILLKMNPELAKGIAGQVER